MQYSELTIMALLSDTVCSSDYNSLRLQILKRKKLSMKPIAIVVLYDTRYFMVAVPFL